MEMADFGPVVREEEEKKDEKKGDLSSLTEEEFLKKDTLLF